ncbi:hypothetical protein BLNAU_6674 [Blattamonas nauphoetae]|uniref:Protein kinase domain-containing protein n=1 Tax=Blattamonas nauphoetae TaxID=2049346 RepID=A0ABQ9Y3Z6_9EUKA|nr:hypothetical protein BLNAU_6674 [Blattamonas nauphoetae]
MPLPKGIYIGNNIEIAHRWIELTGEPSNDLDDLKTELITLPKSDDTSNSDDGGRYDFGTCIFSLTNSTLSLKWIDFSLIDNSVEGRRQRNEDRAPRLAIVSSSMLTISESRIDQSPWTSPIVISPSKFEESTTESSVVVKKCSIRNDIGEMRGIVETSAFASFGGSISVSIVGCSFNSQIVLGKDGIGLSMTQTHRKRNEEVGSISSSLIGCVFVNMSSIGSCEQPCLPHLSQKMLGCVVSLTSSHLSGSTIRDVNHGGSLHCLNSSFSSLLSSPNTNSDPPRPTVTLPGESPKDFVDGTVYAFTYSSSNYYEHTPAVFSHCPFTGGLYNSDVRVIRFYNFNSTVSVLSCSFTNFASTFSGPAINFQRFDKFNNTFLTLRSSNFTNCTGDSSGGAISLYHKDTNLITSCRFENCSATPDYYGRCEGGALYCYRGDTYGADDRVEHDLKMVDCIFSDCTTGQRGGGVHLQHRVNVSIVDTKFDFCQIFNTTASTYGGGISAYGEAPLKVERCHFVSCSCSHGGGAIGTQTQIDVSISDTLVKDCVSGSTGAFFFIARFKNQKLSFSNVFFDGNVVGEDTAFFSTEDLNFTDTTPKFPDIAIMCPDPNFSSTVKFELCYTTIISDSTGMIIQGTLHESNLYEPVRYFDPEFDKFGPILTAAPTGRLNVRTGKIELEMKGKTPPIAQEYEVTAKEADNSETKFKMLFSGDTDALVSASQDRLKYNTDYTITKIVGTPSSSSSSTMANDIALPQAAWIFNLSATPSFLHFTTPEAPPILKASCRVGSGTDHAWIQLTGLNITTGTYSVKLKDVAFPFDVSFSDLKDENGQKQSTEASVRLFGDGNKLTFNKEYTLESLTDSASNAVDLRGMIVTFSTPQATDRIVGIGTMDFTNTQKDEVSVSLSGADMANAEYIIEISPSNLLNDDTISVTFTDQSGTLDGSVYSADGDPVHFEFGETYEIVSITRTNSQPILFFDTLNFSVPAEPARIESTSSVLNGPKTAVNVTLNGTALISAAMTVTVKNPSSNREFTSSLSFVDSTSCTVTFPTGQTETDAELVFGGLYDIVSIESSDGKSFVVNTGVKVRVPSAPIIDSISSSLSENCSHFEIVFGGSSLPSIGSLVASLSPSITLSLSYVDGKWTTGWLSNVETGMLMNTDYSVTKVASGDNEMILNKDSFKTPLGPTLSSIPTVTLKDDDLNSVVVSLDGHRMPVSSVVASFDLIVVESGGSSEEITIDVSFSSNEAGSGEVEVYKTGKLKYSTSYSVVRMTSAVVSVSIPSAVSFWTPAAPTRIISASCDLDTDTGKSAEIVLNGMSFPQSTPFTLTVFELDDSNLKTGNAIELLSSFETDGSSTLHTLSSLIYGNDASKLMFEKWYEVTKLEIANMKTIVDDLARFVIHPEPSRLTTISDSVNYFNKQTELSVALSGYKLTGLFTVTLKRNVSTIPIDVMVTFSDASAGDLKGILYSQLNPSSVNMTYDTKYSIVSMEDSSNGKVFVEEGLSFTTMGEPGRIESTSSLLNGPKTEVTVTLTGRELFSATMTVKLTNPSKSREFTSSLSFVDANSCTVTFPAAQTESETALAFDELYDIVSIESSDGKSFVVNTGVNVSVPSAPIITSISSLLSPNCTHFSISFSGSSLPSIGSFVASISPSISLALSYESGKWTTGWLSNVQIGMSMNTSYSVTKVASGDNEMILNKDSFKTPLGPTLSSIPTVTLKDDDLNSVVVSLDGHRMPVSSVVASFDLIVVESGGSSEEITIDVSFSSNEAGSGEVEVYKTGKLKYSTSYSVVRMTSAVVSVSIPSAVSFWTPAAPTRIISASCDLDTDTGKSAEIVLNGMSFPQSTPFTLTVFELDDSNLKTGNAIELLSSFETDGSSTLHTLSSLIYGNDASKLMFEKWYEVTKLEIANMKTIVDDLARFHVPSEPSRLIAAAQTVDLSMNFSTLTLTTRQLHTNQKYTVVLSGTPIQPSNSDSVHTLDFEVDGAPSITKVLSLYPEATLRFNHLYKVTSMKLKSPSTPIFIESEACSFSTPAEPTRIVDGDGRLNSQRTEVVVTLTGLALKEGAYSFTLTHTITANSRTITGSLNSDGNVECSHTVEESNTNSLIFGETYTITSATLNAQPILFDSDILIEVPHPPKVTGASFTFKNSPNTTCAVTLTGSDLNLKGNYLVTLSDGPTLTIFFNDPKKAVSPILLIGRAGTLQFDTAYSVVSIKKVKDETDVVLVNGPVSFNTESKPNPLVMIVDETIGSTSADCGDSVNPCSSVDAAREIASILSISKVTLKVVTSVAQTQPWLISHDGSLDVTKVQIGIPTLRIASSASMGEEEGMIVVDGGILEIRDISVMIENGSDSFVFVFGRESTIFFVGSSITGSDRTTNSDELDDVCTWSGGVLRLVNCTTLVDNVKLTHHSQGAINMDGGSLTIELSTFHDNTPNHKSFPSFRRNVYCTGSACIIIESLFGGDGSKEHPSAWFSLNNCNLTGEDVKSDTPLFIPTLSTESTSTLNKTNKAFSIDVKGSTLIPCGLWLEIVEVTKEKIEGTSEKVELTTDSCSSISESCISVDVAQSLLSSLNDNLEWRGRLVFGNNVTSETSFVIQKSSADRISQSVRDNMKWWLPLVIVVVSLALIVIVIIVICFRRRKSSSSEKKDTASTELDADIVVKLETDEYCDSFNHDITTSHRQLNSYGIHAEPDSLGASTCKDDGIPSTSVEEVEVLVCGEECKIEIVQKNETLFDRLHGLNKQRVDAVAVGKEIVKGLRHLSKSELFSVSLAKWTPHWVVLDSKDRVCIRLNEEPRFQVNQHGRPLAIDDGQRWRAPEQSNGQLGVNEERVSVFRLGLVLLEMRTGMIPFGEIDATNASRQVCAGLLPPHKDVDEGFMSIVRECLTINANDRPLLMEVEDKLEQYASSRKMDGKAQTASGGKTEALQSRPTVEFAH